MSSAEQAGGLPAVRDSELDRFARLGQWLALSESGKETEQAKGAAAALRLYYADALELPPLAAAELSVIKGRLVVSAKLLRALAARGGFRVVRVEENEHGVTAALLNADTGEELGRATYTMEDAQRAGLIRERGTWQTYPMRMMWARASKFVIDDYAPQVALGLLVEEEAEEIVNPPPPVDPEVADIEFGVDDVEEYESKFDLADDEEELVAKDDDS